MVEEEEEETSWKAFPRLCSGCVNTGAIFDGPLALDNAINPDAAKIRKIDE